MSHTHREYLIDLGTLLREEAVEAKQDAQESKGTPEEGFHTGRAMAYFEVVSLMRQQADAYALSLEDLGLDGLDIGRELFGPKEA